MFTIVDGRAEPRGPAFLKWRHNYRRGDEETFRLTKARKPGDRVYFDPGPGLRVSGTLKDWKEAGMAVVEIDPDDRALVNTQTIMEVPVR